VRRIRRDIIISGRNMELFLRKAFMKMLKGKIIY
jgi:hypothetical protein